MRNSVLHTIPIDQPFAYQMSGYGFNYKTGALIADGSRLLPFESYVFIQSGGLLTPFMFLKSVCGNYTARVGYAGTKLLNNKVTFYFPGEEIDVVVPPGYYYMETTNTNYKFKTEIFYIPPFTDTLKGSFNESFNESFDK